MAEVIATRPVNPSLLANYQPTAYNQQVVTQEAQQQQVLTRDYLTYLRQQPTELGYKLRMMGNASPSGIDIGTGQYEMPQDQWISMSNFAMQNINLSGQINQASLGTFGGVQYTTAGVQYSLGGVVKSEYSTVPEYGYIGSSIPAGAVKTGTFLTSEGLSGYTYNTPNGILYDVRDIRGGAAKSGNELTTHYIFSKMPTFGGMLGSTEMGSIPFAYNQNANLSMLTSSGQIQVPSYTGTFGWSDAYANMQSQSMMPTGVGTQIMTPQGGMSLTNEAYSMMQSRGTLSHSQIWNLGSQGYMYNTFGNNYFKMNYSQGSSMPNNEDVFSKLAMTMGSRPIDMLHYGVFYDPFGLRESIAGLSVRLMGGSKEDSLKAAFDVQKGYYREAAYNPLGFVGESALSGFFYGVGGVSPASNMIGKIGEVAFKSLMVYGAVDFAKSPTMEKGISLVTGLGMYGAIKSGQSIFKTLQPSTREVQQKIEVQYSEEKPVIAEEIIRSSDMNMLASDYRRVVYYGEPTKDVANAMMIQKEDQTGGFLRTGVIIGGGMTNEYPRIAFKIDTTGFKGSYMSLGTGVRNLEAGAMNAKSVLRVPIESEINYPYTRELHIGFIVDEKPFLKMVNPADIKKTPLSTTFPEWKFRPVKPPEYFEIVSKTGIQEIVPKAELKIAPLRVENVLETSEITAYDMVTYNPPKVVSSIASMSQYMKPVVSQSDKSFNIERTNVDVQKQLKEATIPSMKTMTMQIPEQKEMTAMFMSQTDFQGQRFETIQRQNQQQIQQVRQINQWNNSKPNFDRKTDIFKIPTVDNSSNPFIKKKGYERMRINPNGRSGSRMRLVPRAGLLSMAREMAMNIERGKFQYPENPKPTKSTKRRFANELLSNLGSIEFPTERMIGAGKTTKFSAGRPNIENIMPFKRGKK